MKNEALPSKEKQKEDNNESQLTAQAPFSPVQVQLNNNLQEDFELTDDHQNDTDGDLNSAVLEERKT